MIGRLSMTISSMKYEDGKIHQDWNNLVDLIEGW